jgi:hypothetical protein
MRLGTPWSFKNAEHLWDVLLSFVSFTITLNLFSKIEVVGQ